VAIFRDFETKDSFVELGFQYAESLHFRLLVCTFYILRISSLIARRAARLFYAVEFSAYYKIPGESGERVALEQWGQKFEGISPLENREVCTEKNERRLRRRCE
jgi:hypothetical protein